MTGRNGLPEDFAGAAVFLASGASGYVTGQSIFVDGVVGALISSVPDHLAGPSSRPAPGAEQFLGAVDRLEPGTADPVEGDRHERYGLVERADAGADGEGMGYVFASPTGGPLSPNTGARAYVTVVCQMLGTRRAQSSSCSVSPM